MSEEKTHKRILIERLDALKSEFNEITDCFEEKATGLIIRNFERITKELNKADCDIQFCNDTLAVTLELIIKYGLLNE